MESLCSSLCLPWLFIDHHATSKCPLVFHYMRSASNMVANAIHLGKMLRLWILNFYFWCMYLMMKLWISWNKMDLNAFSQGNSEWKWKEFCRQTHCLVSLYKKTKTLKIGSCKATILNWKDPSSQIVLCSPNSDSDLKLHKRTIQILLMLIFSFTFQKEVYHYDDVLFP